MPYLCLTNPERIARGLKPLGRKPGPPKERRDSPRALHEHRETQPVQERLHDQVQALIGRANATMERWRRGER